MKYSKKKSYIILIVSIVDFIEHNFSPAGQIWPLKRKLYIYMVYILIE